MLDPHLWCVRMISGVRSSARGQAERHLGAEEAAPDDGDDARFRKLVVSRTADGRDLRNNRLEALEVL